MPVQYHKKTASSKSIAEELERAIDAGRYRGGESLPTIRGLAEELGVSPTTVNAAFAILRAQGRIVGKRRGGSVVVGRIELQRAGEVAPFVGRNLAVANPDPAFLPALKPVIDRLLGERRLYTDIVDNADLISFFRSELEADRVDARQIGIASGAMDAIERGLMAMTAPGDTIGIEDPTYPPYATMARALGLRVVRLPLDAQGITVPGLRAALAARAKAIVVVPRAQNPTGASFDAKRARELRALLKHAPDVGVIEDDYLAIVAGTPLHSIADGQTRWLHVRSLAKTIGPDIRVAPFAADELTLARIIARQRIGCGWVSNLLQDTAAAVLRAPSTRKLLRSATAAYAKRREAFLAACTRHGLHARGYGGLTVWVETPDEADAVRSALAAGFAIDAGARYREHAAPGVRVTITTMTAEESETLARALARASSTYP